MFFDAVQLFRHRQHLVHRFKHAEYVGIAGIDHDAILNPRFTQSPLYSRMRLWSILNTEIYHVITIAPQAEIGFRLLGFV